MLKVGWEGMETQVFVTRVRGKAQAEGRKGTGSGKSQASGTENNMHLFHSKVKKGFVQQPCYTDPCSPSYAGKLEKLFFR